MIKIIDFFANILSYIINPIYNLVGNYGVAVILFTVIVKVLLVPLGVKQQKTMVKTKQIKPELDKIQSKYKNDKEKLNEETMKLYQKYDINPMGGCLPLLVQFPILLGLYRVIQHPINWILRSNPVDAIEKIITEGKMTESAAAEALRSLCASADKIAGLNSVSELVGAFEKDASLGVTQIDIASKFHLVNFNFLGLDLSATPSISELSWLWIIPIFATGAAFFSNWVSSKINPITGDQAQTMKSMNLMMPLMTLFFTFTLSAGIGVYWFFSTMLSVAQMYLLTKYFEKKYPSVANTGKGKK